MTYLKKYLIEPEQVSKIPESFSWIDRRIMHMGYLERLCSEAILLYFFFFFFGDHKGLSFYGQKSICRLLKIRGKDFTMVRSELVKEGLIAYSYPIYQVLPLREEN